MYHLDPKDLSKSTPIPNCTEAIVELGLDACVIDCPMFSTLMIWSDREIFVGFPEPVFLLSQSNQGVELLDKFLWGSTSGECEPWWF